MDRTSIGDLHQPRACGFGHVALDGDVAGDLADVAFPGIAIRAVLRVDPAVREACGEPFGIDPLAIVIDWRHMRHHPSPPRPACTPGSAATAAARRRPA